MIISVFLIIFDGKLPHQNQNNATSGMPIYPKFSIFIRIRTENWFKKRYFVRKTIFALIIGKLFSLFIYKSRHVILRFPIRHLVFIYEKTKILHFQPRRDRVSSQPELIPKRYLNCWIYYLSVRDPSYGITILIKLQQGVNLIEGLHVYRVKRWYGLFIPTITPYVLKPFGTDVLLTLNWNKCI